MARRLLLLAAALGLLAACAPTSFAAEPQNVLVRFAKGADAADRQVARDEAGTDLQEVLPLRGLQLVDPEPGVSVNEAIETLESEPGVLYAEPDQVRTASVVPNDDFFNVLWGMNNTGQVVDGV